MIFGERWVVGLNFYGYGGNLLLRDEIVEGDSKVFKIQVVSNFFKEFMGMNLWVMIFVY